jgi:triacylglycerol esterase/lipase EstA (alpha/beta hydrolase family)
MISRCISAVIIQRRSGPYEIRNCADEVFAALTLTDVDGHPPVMEKEKITFVCHSRGGIVARYLLEANQRKFETKQVGLVLIASPSNGSKLANTLQNLITVFNRQQGVQLRWGNWSLTDLDDRFRELKENRLLWLERRVAQRGGPLTESVLKLLRQHAHQTLDAQG